jgi:hypothetical protein
VIALLRVCSRRLGPEHLASKSGANFFEVQKSPWDENLKDFKSKAAEPVSKPGRCKFSTIQL